VEHLILLRDGITPTKAKEAGLNEFSAIETILGKTKCTYVLLNKRNTLKIFKRTPGRNVENIPPGKY
jgi:hypothetical protein